MSLKSRVTSDFKLHGFTLRSEGAQYLCGLLERIPQHEHQDTTDKVVTALQKLPLTSAVISKQNILEAVKEVSATVNASVNTVLHVIPPKDVPRLTYNVDRCKFLVAPNSRPLHGVAADKTELFRNRYNTVFQRTRQHKLFRPPPVGMPASQSKHFGLTKVEFLVGGGGTEENVVVLGMLTQITEGKLHLEDDTGAVPLDMKDTKFHTGLFPHNCLVLVEGSYDDGVLRCNAVGLPPAETADTSRAMLGNVNYFGGPGTGCAKYCERMQAAEGRREAMFVLMSDVWLDKVRVVAKLEALFAGYNAFPPTAFVFCGNFSSSCHTSAHVSALKQAFTKLGDMISQHTELVSKSKFIFVPGPADPGLSTIYPRPPLPAPLVEDFVKKVPSAQFVSNPCRIQYCTKEIVIFREDVMTKICRNCIYFPDDKENLHNHFAKTIVSQAHLSPLPLHVLPTYWGQDNCLSLHPSPDLVVTADRADPFTSKTDGVTVVNPGSFMKTDFSFKVFYPNRNEVEDSHIRDSPDETM